jgi:predicted deacylase
MKFGKQLLLKQKKQWSQSYINYKAAKKIIKKLRQSLPKDWDPTKLSAPIEETYSKEFFDLLNQELQKIKEFYAEKEQRVVEEFSRLKSSQKETRFIYEDALELSEKIAALNDYVTLNVTGFSKILKKHDKHLKANTKKKYLQKVFSLDMVKNHTLDDLESQIHTFLLKTIPDEEISHEPKLQKDEKQQTIHAPVVDELEIDKLEPHKIHHLWIKISENAMSLPIQLPLLVAKGRPGPILGITAAIHGNEINGIPLIHRLFSEIDVNELCGTVIACIVVNPIGYMRKTREFDNVDLNRIFPGKANGTVSDIFVYRLLHNIISKFEYHLDLHTASFGRINSLYIRADMTDPVASRMALLQNAQIIVHHAGIDGSMRNAAMQLGIKSITVEIGNPQSFQKRYIKHALLGVTQTMKYLKMIPSDEEIKLNQPTLVSHSYWLYTDVGGVLVVFPDVNTWVRKGEKVAQVKSIFGTVVKVYYAPEDGIVIGKNNTPVNQTGDRILHLGIVKGYFGKK